MVEVKQSKRDGRKSIDALGAARILSIGEIARRSGISVSALHFYEREGLIRSWRSDGNQRRYPAAVLRRLAVIKAAQTVGVPLSEITEVLDSLPEGRMPGRADWAAMSRRWRERLNQRIERLSKLRDQLDVCIGCGCLSLKDCPLRNPGDKLAKLGPGAHLLSAE